MSASNELRVFISSTFRDLQDEGEHLLKKIFPEMIRSEYRRGRALCRERGISFLEVDLRWGLTHEDKVQGQVLRTCLAEIDRCRPYFFGIIDNCCGRVPEFHYRSWRFWSPEHASAAFAGYEAPFATTPQHEHHKRIEELWGAHGHYSF